MMKKPRRKSYKKAKKGERGYLRKQFEESQALVMRAREREKERKEALKAKKMEDVKKSEKMNIEETRQQKLKKEMEEKWRKQEKKNKEEIVEMKKKQEAEKKRREEIKKKIKDADEKNKKLMEEVRMQNAIRDRIENKKNECKILERDITAQAASEADHKKREADQQAFREIKAVHRKYQKLRSDIDMKEKTLKAEASEEARKEKLKSNSLEQGKRLDIKNTYQRKRMQAQGIANPNIKRRELQNIDREEHTAILKLEDQIRKKFAEIESKLTIEKFKITNQAKHDRSTATQEERKIIMEIKNQKALTKRNADQERLRKIKEIPKLKQAIMDRDKVDDRGLGWNI